MKWWLGVALAIAACGGGGAEMPPADECSDDDAPTWSNFGQGFMEAHCTRCHGSDLTGAARMGAPRGYDFDSPDTVARYAIDIDQELSAGSMPPEGEKPSAEDVDRLRAWLDCGAP